MTKQKRVKTLRDTYDEYLALKPKDVYSKSHCYTLIRKGYTAQEIFDKVRSNIIVKNKKTYCKQSIRDYLQYRKDGWTKLKAIELSNLHPTVYRFIMMNKDYYTKLNLDDYAEERTTIPAYGVQRRNREGVDNSGA